MPLEPAETRPRSNFPKSRVAFTRLQSAKLNTDETVLTQGPEEMYLSLEHENPSKTSEKMGYFDRVTVSVSFVTHSIDRKPRD